MRRRGQGLVEFALALPLLLFLAMAIADFGRILLVYAELGGGVREALRYAIV
jgi:Flp pilus assembly protein TadG